MSPCPGVALVKTRVNRSGWVTVSEQCNHILMLPWWVPEIPGPGEGQEDQRHEVQVRFHWEPQSPGLVRPCLGSESPVRGEARVDPESPGTQEAKVRTRVTSIRSVPVGNRVTISRCYPGGYQRHQVLVRPRWDQRHEVQVSSRCVPQSTGQVRPCIGSESPVTGEAKKESTANRSRCGTKSPRMGEAQMGTRFTRSR